MSSPNNIDISIIIPGIRNNNWLNIYNQLYDSVGKYSFELICVGPYEPPEELSRMPNFKFIQDFGHPNRCLQRGALEASGEFVCWIPDDSRIDPKGLELCLDMMYDDDKKRDGVCLKYSEGVGFTGDQHLNNKYWVGSTHEDQRLKQVHPSWKIAPLFMYRRSLYEELGGLDCRFELANISTHDLAYRVQRSGGSIHLSPTRILAVDWIPGQAVITEAHFENDIPIFNELYNTEILPRINIDINNWKNSSNKWKRRFGINDKTTGN